MTVQALRNVTAFKGIPTLILFQDGVEKERIVGVASQEKISRTIDRYIRTALN